MPGGGREQEEMEVGRSGGEDAGGGGGDFRNGTNSCEEAILSLSKDIYTSSNLQHRSHNNRTPRHAGKAGALVSLSLTFIFIELPAKKHEIVPEPVLLIWTQPRPA